MTAAAKFSLTRLRAPIGAALAFALTALLPCPTSARADRLDTTVEKALGGIVTRTLEGASGTDEDPLLAGWVRRVGEPFTRLSPRADLPPRFVVLRSDVANAITAPGGTVYVTRGLLDSVESDDELACVLGHETGHVAKRHAWQQVQNQLIGLAAISLVHGGRELRLAAVLGNVLFTLHKSREMEAQADDVGLHLAAAAGYDPRGLSRFLGGLGNGPTGLAEYFATHPTPQRRIESAKKDPWIALTDPDTRHAVASGFDARGLHRSAERIREGRDALAPVSVTPILTPAALEPARAELSAKTRGALHGLGAGYKVQTVSATLQQLLLVNSRLNDLRWIILAGQAYALQAQVSDVYARTARTLRLAPRHWDALSVDGFDPIDAAVGRGEIEHAVDLASGVNTPLKRAANAAALALADLNNRFLVLGRSEQQWARFAAIEGLVQYANRELERADKTSAEAWRLLAQARIRRYLRELDTLAPLNDPVARERWRDLASRRLGYGFWADGKTSDATVRAALALELGVPETQVAAARGREDWVAWIGRQNGSPENIATTLRLLVFDLEREARE